MLRRSSRNGSPPGTPTGSPSKINSPVSLGSRCINSRASVDLPQPDSPTTPSVSPFNTVNDTPSTAFTSATFRLRIPPWIGKYRCKSRAISIGCADAAAIGRLVKQLAVSFSFMMPHFRLMP